MKRVTSLFRIAFQSTTRHVTATHRYTHTRIIMYYAKTRVGTPMRKRKYENTRTRIRNM